MRQRVATALGRLRRRTEPPTPGFSSPDEELATLTRADRRIVEQARPYTMTSVARLTALIDAVRYCVRREIPGAFVECGVWRGGSILAMILSLEDMDRRDREIYLYDTFEGMTQPTERDVSPHDGPALEAWRKAQTRASRPWPEFFDRDVFSEDDVRAMLLETGYPPERLHFVRGPVEETLPARAPGEISLLRLDTDWYESTRCEMEHLYPRLSPGGVLIVDDYGHWQGARDAVDEYLAAHDEALLLSRVDYTARIAVKH
jgi:O-methyltransferase